MTGGIASSRPLRALSALLWVWAIGRAAFEFGPVIWSTHERPIRQAAILANSALPKVRAASHSGHPTQILAKSMTFDDVRFVEPERSIAKNLLMVSHIFQKSPFRDRSAVSVYAASTLPPSVISRPFSVEMETARVASPPLRLSISAWLLVRDGGNGLATAGTLGGPQAGVRAYFPLNKTIAATGRLSTPLRASGAEASIGLALRHGPFAVLLERRIALERGGRNDFSVTAAAGIDDVHLPLGCRLDAYGQAGIVGTDGFADGAVRIERQIFARRRTEIAIGAGVWGGAQPGISRLDTGPEIVMRTPIAGGTLRASAEWRQRIAGNAQPASGPALTIGVDF